MAIMRKPEPLPIPLHLVNQSRLYAPGRNDLDAVCHILEDYPRRVAELRSLRSRVVDLDREGFELDKRLEALVAACEAVLELSR